LLLPQLVVAVVQCHKPLCTNLCFKNMATVLISLIVYFSSPSNLLDANFFWMTLQNVMNRNMDHPTGLPKLKITIPREPELATKLRAERPRVLRSV
jgi:hypothetical protein